MAQSNNALARNYEPTLKVAGAAGGLVTLAFTAVQVKQGTDEVRQAAAQFRESVNLQAVPNCIAYRDQLLTLHDRGMSREQILTIYRADKLYGVLERECGPVDVVVTASE